MNRILTSTGYFPDPSTGRPIALGKIYVGTPGTDPTVAGNQKTLYVREEDGSLTAVSQPLYTGSGGVPMYDGSPVSIFVDGDYALRVDDADDVQKYYVPSIEAIAGNTFYPNPDATDHGITGNSDTIYYFLNQIGTTNKATIYLRNNSQNEFTDYNYLTSADYSAYNNIQFIIENGARFNIDSGKTINFYSPNNINALNDQYIFDGVVSFNDVNGIVYPEWWGAIGDTVTSDTDALQNMIEGIDNITIWLSKKYLCELLLFEDKSNLTFLSNGIGGFKLSRQVTDEYLLRFLNCSDVLFDNVDLEGYMVIPAPPQEEIATIYTASVLCIWNGSENFTVRNCKIHDNTHQGIDIRISSNIYIDNCIIDTTDVSVIVEKSTDLWFTNNIMKNGTSESIALYYSPSDPGDCEDVHIFNNDLYKQVEFFCCIRCDMQNNRFYYRFALRTTWGTEDIEGRVVTDLNIVSNIFYGAVFLTSPYTEDYISGKAQNIVFSNNLIYAYKSAKTSAVLSCRYADYVDIFNNIIIVAPDLGVQYERLIAIGYADVTLEHIRFMNNLVRFEGQQLADAPSESFAYIENVNDLVVSGNKFESNYTSPILYIKHDNDTNIQSHYGNTYDSTIGFNINRGADLVRYDGNVSDYNNNAVPTITSASTIDVNVPIKYNINIDKFRIVGNTTIDTINGYLIGKVVTLYFIDTGCTVSGTGNVSLKSAFTSTAGDILTIMYLSTSWVEVSRN